MIRLKSLIIFLFQSALLFTSSSQETIELFLSDVAVNPQWQEINNYITGLNYDDDEILAFRSEPIKIFKKKEGHLDASKSFIVVTREPQSVSNGKTNIGVIASREHDTYPGSILLANHRFIDNNPDFISIDRSPLQYTVNLPGLAKEGSFNIIPEFSEYQASLNQVLDTWYEKNPEINANFQSESTLAYNEAQLKVKFGLGFENYGVGLNIDFNAAQNNDKLIMIRRFQQIFYTVSVKSPTQPANVFGTGVTLEEVKDKMDSRNPPMMINSVSYGRNIFVKIETSSTDDEAKSVLNNQLTFFKMNDSLEVDYSNKLKDLNMRIYVLGGSTDQIQLIDAKTEKEVNEVIIRYGKFNRTNPGYPLSYSAKFLKGNRVGMVHGSAEFIESKRIEYMKSVLQFSNQGWMRSKWYVLWDEVNFATNGTEVVEKRRWEKVLGSYSILADVEYEATLELPGNAQNVSIGCFEFSPKFNYGWWPIQVFQVPLVPLRKLTLYKSKEPNYRIDPPLPNFYRLRSYLHKVTKPQKYVDSAYRIKPPTLKERIN